MSRDLQVLKMIYDRLFDAISYSPSSNQPSAFDRTTSMIQFASNQAIREQDFANAFSPMNPNGDMRTAEIFSRMVDAVPTPQILWKDSGNKVSETYQAIVNGANTLQQPDKKQLEEYNAAYNYLHTTETLKDFKGNETKQEIDSPIYARYKTNIQSYAAALSSYRLTWANYNLDDAKQQREWQAKEPVLNAAVNAAWDNLQQGGGRMVEEALHALTTTVNSAVRNVIDQSQRIMRSGSLASVTAGSPPWYLAYATPTNWTSAGIVSSMTDLNVDTSHTTQSSDSSFDKWGASTSGSWGLWHYSAQAGGTSGSQTFQSTSTGLKVAAKIGLVRIYRPWYNPLLFTMKDWTIDGYGKNAISDGGLRGTLPMVSTAFIVARELVISGTFSSEDRSHVEKSISGSASGGWGPFSISGSYAHSDSHDRLESSFDGTSIRVPGMQIIGFVNALTPACPSA